jgi:hypothetical protein
MRWRPQKHRHREASHHRDRGSWWSVNPTGNYADDYQTGRTYAAALMPMMLRNAGPPTLSVILGDMFDTVSDRHGSRYRQSKLSGIEIGFMRGLGDLILAGLAATVMMGTVDLRKRVMRKPRRGAAEVAMKLSLLLATSLWDSERASEEKTLRRSASSVH